MEKTTEKQLSNRYNRGFLYDIIPAYELYRKRFLFTIFDFFDYNFDFSPTMFKLKILTLPLLRLVNTHAFVLDHNKLPFSANLVILHFRTESFDHQQYANALRWTYSLPCRQVLPSRYSLEENGEQYQPEFHDVWTEENLKICFWGEIIFNNNIF